MFGDSQVHVDAMTRIVRSAKPIPTEKK